MLYMLRANFFITEKCRKKGIIEQTALIRHLADGIKCTELHQTEDTVRCYVADDGVYFDSGFVRKLWLGLRVSISCSLDHHITFSVADSSCSFQKHIHISQSTPFH